MGCAKIEVKDVEVCGDKGVGATCFHTLSSHQRRIPGPQWEQMRIGRLSMGSKDFSDTLASLLKLCNRTKQCSFQEEQLLQSLVNKSQEVEFENDISLEDGMDDSVQLEGRMDDSVKLTCLDAIPKTVPAHKKNRASKEDTLVW